MNTAIEDTDPTPNVDLIKEVANWIRTQVEYAPYSTYRRERAETNPDTAPDLIWDQGDWASSVFGAECKTACCIAGYVALTDPQVDADQSRDYGAVYFTDHRPIQMWEEFARTKLGLTEYQASVLFYSSGQDVDYILGLLSEYAGEPV